MTRDRISVDDALDQLRDELAIALPRNFQSRIRARVSSVRRADRSSVHRVSTCALAAALVMTGVWFAQAYHLRDAMASIPAPTPAARSLDSWSRPETANLTPVTAWRQSSREVSTAAQRSERSSGIDRGDRFEVLVPPDQARAIAALLGRMRAPRSDTIPAAADPIVPVPELTAIQVTPIQIELLPAPSAGRPERNLP